MATAEAARRDFTITKMERAPEGFVKARVTANGQTVEVDNRHGSWLASVRPYPGARRFIRKDVLAPVPSALQAKARQLGLAPKAVRR